MSDAPAISTSRTEAPLPASAATAVSNAARTLRHTYDEVMAHGIVDLVIVVDDASHDETVAIARTLPNVQVEVHPENRGYGANQKTCYRLALAAGADIVMLDNFPPERIEEAVARVAGRALVEVSGGVTLARIPELAKAGVDLISVGALTHSAGAADISLELELLGVDP